MGEIKIVATEHQPVVTIQEVVRMTVVTVQPVAIRVTFDVEDLEVAIGVCNVRGAIRNHCSLNRLMTESRGCILFWAL